MTPALQLPASLQDAYDAVDWAATDLGPIEAWTPALRGVADTMLHSRFPLTLLWGPEFRLIYNEAYLPLIADKHPSALGGRAADVFPEAWDAIGPVMQRVRAGHGPSWVQDAPVPLHRSGFLEEAYFTFSYSPVHGADGAVEGVLDIVAETTHQVVAARRLRTLGRLQGVLAHDGTGALERALAVLRTATGEFAAVDIGPAAGRGTTGTTTTAWLTPADDPEPLVLGLTRNPLVVDERGYADFVRLVVAALSQALDRLRRRESARTLSEALQDSLLTAPPPGDGIEIAARYEPAAEQAHVGGDWHDAFPLPDGSLAIGVGDVTGHDRNAAAGMGQLRNLLRGIARQLPDQPAACLAALDDAMDDLRIETFATAVHGRVAPPDATGARTLCWVNAGHLPPVLIEPDGRARLLEAPPDVLLGIGPGATRTEHEVLLRPGAVLLLYTDGLVERRGSSLSAALDRLVVDLEGRHELSPEALCRLLMARPGPGASDDVALLALRIPAPEPASSGP